MRGMIRELRETDEHRQDWEVRRRLMGCPDWERSLLSSPQHCVPGHDDLQYSPAI
jgi:hypothetical protein